MNISILHTKLDGAYYFCVVIVAIFNSTFAMFIKVADINCME